MNFIKSSFQKYKKQILIILIILVIFIVTKPYNCGVNDGSRMATIESLVNRHTFIINNSNYNTIDKIFHDGHFYSTKPPVLTIIGAAIFWFLKNIFGLSLQGEGVSSLAQYIITLIIVGGSFIALLYTFFKSLHFFNLNENTKYILTFLLGFGTYIFSYLGTLNNHIPTTAAVFISFYYLLKIKFNKPNIANNLFLCGLFLGLAAVLDLASMTFIWIIFYFIYFFKTLKNKRNLIYLIIGWTLPIFLHLILNLQITGDLLPPYLHKEWYYYPGSFWNKPSAKQSKLLYFFHITFGHNGLFIYSPALLISTWQLIKIIRNKLYNFYQESILIASIICASIILVTFCTYDYGGNAYAMRWFMAFIPLLFFFNVFYFIEKNKFSLLFQTLAILSIVLAIIGIIEPWSARVSITLIKNEYSMQFPLLSNLLKLIIK